MGMAVTSEKATNAVLRHAKIIENSLHNQLSSLQTLPLIGAKI